MKKRQNNSARTSALRITFISLSAVLLTLKGAPAKNQFEQKPAWYQHGCTKCAPRGQLCQRLTMRRDVQSFENGGRRISASHQRVGGRENRRLQCAHDAGGKLHTAGWTQAGRAGSVAGDGATAGGASGRMELASFYPTRYGEPFVVEGHGVRVVVRPGGGADVTAQIDNAQVTYRNAYAETDSMHVVSSGRSEEFLFLKNECAPREFAYRLSEVSTGTRVELVKGEVHFTNRSGQGVKIEAPWLVEASGKSRTDAVHWELDATKSAAGPQRLRLVIAAGLRYPVVIDPSWTATGSLNTARRFHTATLLPSGKVLVAGGQGNGNNTLSSAELYDPAAGTWTATGSLAPHATITLRRCCPQARCWWREEHVMILFS